MYAAKMRLRYLIPLISSIIFFATLIDAQFRHTSCYQFDGNGHMCTTLINATIATHLPSSFILYFMDRYEIIHHLPFTRIIFLQSTYNVWIVIIYSWYLFIGITVNYCIGWILEKVTEKIHQTFFTTHKYQSAMKMVM